MKISLVENSRRCRLIVEGELIAPWVAEFRTACKKAIDGLHGRELIIGLGGVTAVSPEGESALVHLMCGRRTEAWPILKTVETVESVKTVSVDSQYCDCQTAFLPSEFSSGALGLLRASGFNNSFINTSVESLRILLLHPASLC
jgi:hypothetical protein